MKRRTLLKALVLAPIIAPIARFIRQPDESPKPQIAPDAPLVQKRGKLYVMIGDAKVGKTSLAKAMAKRHGLVLLDDVHKLEHPDKDCELLVSHGANVLAVIGASSRVQDSVVLDAASPHSICDMWMRSDWMFEVAYRRNDNLYAGTTLRDRGGNFPNAFVWTVEPDYLCFMTDLIDSDLCSKS